MNDYDYITNNKKHQKLLKKKIRQKRSIFEFYSTVANHADCNCLQLGLIPVIWENCLHKVQKFCFIDQIIIYWSTTP